MQYIVVTAKHHEGFALFDTNYDRYNCVTGSDCIIRKSWTGTSRTAAVTARGN